MVAKLAAWGRCKSVMAEMEENAKVWCKKRLLDEDAKVWTKNWLLIRRGCKGVEQELAA